MFLEIDEMTEKLRIAVAASGNGTCFQSVLDNIKKGRLDAEVVQLITDNPECMAVERAKENNIPVLSTDVPDLLDILNKESGFKRHERTLAARVLHEDRLLRGYNRMSGILDTAPDHIVLLGYMRVLSEYLIGTCRTENIHIWNTHPAPIPEYRGENGYAWGVGSDRESPHRNEWHCVSFHNVNNAVFDTGKVISSSPLPISHDETEESLKDRGMRKEYEQIRQCLQWIAEGRVIEDDGIFDIVDSQGVSYRDAMKLHEYFAVCSNERYSIVVDTDANDLLPDLKVKVSIVGRPERTSPPQTVEYPRSEYDKQRELSAPVDVEVSVCYTPDARKKPIINSWTVEGIPYNLAFTYARDAVEMLRLDGVEASLMFDEMDIHPVLMKKNMKR